MVGAMVERKDFTYTASMSVLEDTVSATELAVFILVMIHK